MWPSLLFRYSRFLVVVVCGAFLTTHRTDAVEPGPSPPVAQAKSPAHRLPYEPSVVALSGALRRQTFPGPPNYEASLRVTNRRRASIFIYGARCVQPVCLRRRPITTLSRASELCSSFLTRRVTTDSGHALGKR